MDILGKPAKPAGAPGKAGQLGDVVKDTTTKDFVKDVIEASRNVPVIVDFWAPWCGPCKQLTPILEKVVRAAQGKVRLVKMNTDQHPSIAQQLRVQSIPAVFAFIDGRPVDGFMGALPESQVKQFVDRILDAKGEESLEAGIAEALKSASAALEAGDAQGAAEIYAAILQEDKANIEALSGLAGCYLKASDIDRAAATLDMAPEDKRKAPAFTAVKAKIELAKKAGAAGDLGALKRRIEADPKDYRARYDLAIGLAARGDREGALDQLLEIMRRDRKWNEEAARKQLVELFEAWGPNDPLTGEGRRRLSSLLFA
jgi:putative thioredoxin